MAGFRFVSALQALILIFAAVCTVAASTEGVAQPAASAPSMDVDPPAIVIDAEYVPAHAVGSVVYVPHEHQMLAIDAASGSIRAVVPAPPRPIHPSGGLAALVSTNVSIPAFGIVLLVVLFLGMIGIIFLRRTPISA